MSNESSPSNETAPSWKRSKIKSFWLMSPAKHSFFSRQLKGLRSQLLNRSRARIKRCLGAFGYGLWWLWWDRKLWAAILKANLQETFLKQTRKIRSGSNNPFHRSAPEGRGFKSKWSRKISVTKVCSKNRFKLMIRYRIILSSLSYMSRYTSGSRGTAVHPTPCWV